MKKILTILLLTFFAYSCQNDDTINSSNIKQTQSQNDQAKIITNSDDIDDFVKILINDSDYYDFLFKADIFFYYYIFNPQIPEQEFKSINNIEEFDTWIIENFELTKFKDYDEYLNLKNTLLAANQNLFDKYESEFRSIERNTLLNEEFQISLEIEIIETDNFNNLFGGCSGVPGPGGDPETNCFGEFQACKNRANNAATINYTASTLSLMVGCGPCLIGGGATLYTHYTELTYCQEDLDDCLDEQMD